MSRTLFIILVLLGGFISGCGRKTPPRPVITAAPFSDLNAQQFDGQLRLSWDMRDPQSLPNEAQFFIEELVLKAECAGCQLEPIKTYVLPFPSESFVIEGKTVFFRPALPPGLGSYVFKLTLQNDLGAALSKTESVQFAGFVDFPNPGDLSWKWLSSDIGQTLKQLPLSNTKSFSGEGRFLRFSWPHHWEAKGVSLSGSQDLVEKDIFYKVNFYKSRVGESWKETPYTQKPITENFFIDFVEPSTKAWQYQIRLVDSHGNESLPSKTYEIPGS